MLLEPAWAVGVGGVTGVLAGVVYFRALRAVAGRLAREGAGRGTVVLGLAWRLALVVGLAAAVTYIGGTPGTVAMLVGLVLARVVVPRRSEAA
ncbi:MAG: hypothetical protein ACLFRB_00605 [Thiohalorhabdus sp.]|uniref:hypothetical protein n=1 Tax=Thiohalorhabdus sp. TaxID=3094134 RepID=UPI003980229A